MSRYDNNLLMIKYRNAEIIPIFKANDKHIVSNYRSISSILINIAKILEKVIYTFIQDNALINSSQFVLVKNRDTKNT